MTITCYGQQYYGAYCAIHHLTLWGRGSTYPAQLMRVHMADFHKRDGSSKAPSVMDKIKGKRWVDLDPTKVHKWQSEHGGLGKLSRKMKAL